MTVKMLCDGAGKCDFHDDDGEATDPCLGMCDVPECRRTDADGLWWVEAGPGIDDNPTALCATHLLAVVRAYILRGTTPEDRAR